MTTLTPPRTRMAVVLGYTRSELVRQLRMIESTFFIIALPVFMFFIFNNISSQADAPIGSGNVGGYMMASMATFGAVTATTSITGFAALEQQQGWGRQLGLTALHQSDYFLGKVCVGLLVSLLPILFVFGVGAATGATVGDAGTWVLSVVLCMLSSLPFSLLGLAVALLFRSEAAVSVTSGLIVVLSFLGNLFVPLSGTMLSIARFTPLYGAANLSRWPLMGEGSNEDDTLVTTFLILGAWVLIFALLCGFASRRRTIR